jgi:hypothetical protein
MTRPLRIEFAGALYQSPHREMVRRLFFCKTKTGNCGLKCWNRCAIASIGLSMPMVRWVITISFSRPPRQQPLQRHASAKWRLYPAVQPQTSARWTCVSRSLKSYFGTKKTYLLELSRYIVLNLVRARMVHSAQQWPWSNYRATASMAVSPAWLEIDWILAAFAEDKPQAQRRYQQFVAEGQGQPSLWESLKNQIYLGSEAFVTQMQRNLAGSQLLSEIPKTQQRPNH